MLSSTICAILATGNVLRSAGHFPSSAAVEGKRHFRFSPLRVAAGCRLCTRKKGRVGLSPHVSIPCPRLYGLIRSRLHARGHCELSSASAGFMSFLLVSPLIHFTPLPLSAFLHTSHLLLAGNLLATPPPPQRGFLNGDSSYCFLQDRGL